MLKIKKKYLDTKFRRRFFLRFFCYTLILIILVLTFLYLFDKSYAFSLNETVTYKEVGSVDYKIYLKENEFYDKPYLEKNMAYIASLIDNLNIDFSYIFNVDKYSSIDFKYNIIGNLVIASQNNSNVFFEKKYVLKEDNVKELAGNKLVINENIEIDYAEYNNLANKFRINYAVNTKSYLDVYLQVEQKSKETNSYKLVNTSKISLKIPLSQQEISININDEKLNNEQKIISNSKNVVLDKTLLIISLVLLFIIFIYLIQYIVLVIMLFIIIIYKDNIYDKYVKKILKCYDRIIVNVNSIVDFEKYNVISVIDFQELVDARDNTKEPINYYVYEEHKKCVFYIIHNDDLYLFTVNIDDLYDKDK